MRMWTGLMWLRIGSTSELLCTGNENSGPQKVGNFLSGYPVNLVGAVLLLDLIQRVHKVREHFKLFIAQELQIIQTSYTCHSEEKL
jgi:hypothetical protein